MERIQITKDDFKRINSDINGNPRYVIHYIKFTPTLIPVPNPNNSREYEAVLYLNKKLKLGGRKYHNRSYGGGLAFSTYNIGDLCEFLNKQLNAYFEKFEDEQ